MDSTSSLFMETSPATWLVRSPYPQVHTLCNCSLKLEGTNCSWFSTVNLVFDRHCSTPSAFAVSKNPDFGKLVGYFFYLFNPPPPPTHTHIHPNWKVIHYLQDSCKNLAKHKCRARILQDNALLARILQGNTFRARLLQESCKWFI